jgi:NSS family neurotransmitter:Na+ symporter
MPLFHPKTLFKRTGQWTSSVGFVLATAGAAVGLGNIWMFPYVTGMNGGGAFVLVYLLCILLIGMPIMMAEALIGRYGNQNPIGSLDKMAVASHVSRKWRYLGHWGALALIITMSFYSVVSGWSIGYLVKTLSGAFVKADASVIHGIWMQFIGNPWILLLYHTVFMILTMGVVALGIEKGLERASKIMMPGLILILLLLVGFGLFTGHFMESLVFLFRPDFSQLTTHGVLAAMGLSFFTLALGAGCIVAYASYLPQKTPITQNIAKIVVLDTVVALLAGLAIFPFVFAYGLTPQAGPGLMFEVLPTAFSQMPAGILIGSLFFLLLLFAAWTSSVSIAEPLVAMMTERLHFTRNQAVFWIGLVAWVMGIGVLLSFNVWEGFKLFGRFTLFDVATELPLKVILPIGGFLFAIFAGYQVKPRLAQEALILKNHRLFALWRFLIRYVSPVAVIIVLLANHS